jgi:SAM-dependent methyltransferase
MQFPKANSFPKTLVQSKIMGPNPLKLCEEMLSIADECVGYRAIPERSVALDLGSGAGITTAMLAREYDYTAYAADLWSNPSDNLRFFEQLGLTNHRAIPVKVDASEGMPFAEGFFDAAVSTDSYHYFGRDAEFLDAKLLPYVKRDGVIAACFPGMSAISIATRPHACLRPGRPSSWTTFMIRIGGTRCFSSRRVLKSWLFEKWNALKRLGLIGYSAKTSMPKATGWQLKPGRWII